MSDEIKRCAVCGSTHEETEFLYDYEDEIYCFYCLKESLEAEGILRTFVKKCYVSEGGAFLGDEGDMYSLSEEICDYYGAKRIKE